jgi:ABC-type multidrug transport system fused ATPase/permease subunit
MLVNSATNAVSLGLLIPFSQYILDGSVDFSSLHIPLIGELLTVIPKEDRLNILIGGFVGVILLRTAFTVGSAGMNQYLAHRLWVYWADIVGRTILFARYKEFVIHKQGVLLHNYLREPFQASRGILALLEIITGLLLGIIVYALMLAVNVYLTLAFTVCTGLVLLFVHRMSKTFSVNMGKKRQRLTQQVTAHMAEAINMFKVARVFALEGSLHEKSIQFLNRIKRLNVTFAIFSSAPSGLSDLFIILFITGYIFISIRFLGRDVSAAIPELVFFGASLQRLYSSIAKIFSNWMVFMSEIPSLNLMEDYIRRDSERVESEVAHRDRGGCQLAALGGDIVLRDISFAYAPDVPALHNVSMRIPKGKVTFLIGRSGSGKSTIADILLRLLHEDSGTITINGENIDRYSEDSWRKLISYVSQDVQLFNDTVANNIRYSRMDADEEMIMKAARAAGAHEFILEFPKGYETVVGDRGECLSGGQKQRISIARALLRCPDILILDEATSALDTKTEELFVRTILAARRVPTVIFITHRLALLEYADVIYKVENGTVCPYSPEDSQYSIESPGNARGETTKGEAQSCLEK